MGLKKSLNKQLHALLTKAGLMERKAELVYSFSDNRTEHSSELYDVQAISLVKHLQGIISQSEAKTALEKRKEEQEEAKQKLRRVIISIWYKIENANTPEERKATVKVCKEWVQKNFKSDLNTFSAQDLFKIKLAAEQVYKDRAKSVRRAVTSANT